MPVLSHEDFDARYGDIAARLFDFRQRTCVPGERPNLIFRRPLKWPAIPLPETFDLMCRYVDTYETLAEWLRSGAHGPFDDSGLSILHCWFFRQETRRSLWQPVIATLAENGAGTAAVFEPAQRYVRADDDSGKRYSDDRPEKKYRWIVTDWRAAEDTIADGLPLGFRGWSAEIGDCVCLCDETAAWAIHSWGEGRISYLTAEPALMDRVVEAVGGAAVIGKFISLDCSMNDNIAGMLESYLEYFGNPPFVEMPLRVVRSLDEHLEAHPWLDKAFADL